MRSCISASSTMWKFIFPIIVLANTVRSSDPGDARQNEVNGDQGFAYSFSGNSQNPSAIPFGFPYFPVYNFNPLFSDYFDNLRRFNDELAANIGNNIHTASSFANPGNIPNLESRFSDGNEGAASATGFIGNGQVRQTASVYPQNPGAPNVNTRFGADTGKGGTYGVFTSSYSETVPDKSGKPVTRQKASTTVNDNGKVSSYSVHNP